MAASPLCGSARRAPLGVVHARGPRARRGHRFARSLGRWASQALHRHRNSLSNVATKAWFSRARSSLLAFSSESHVFLKTPCLRSCGPPRLFKHSRIWSRTGPSFMIFVLLGPPGKSAPASASGPPSTRPCWRNNAGAKLPVVAVRAGPTFRSGGGTRFRAAHGQRWPNLIPLAWPACMPSTRLAS